jgi:hypothetical protein
MLGNQPPFLHNFYLGNYYLISTGRCSVGHSRAICLVYSTIQHCLELQRRLARVVRIFFLLPAQQTRISRGSLHENAMVGGQLASVEVF